MSKGKKILVLVLLLIVSTNIFTFAQKVGSPLLALFFSVATLGLLVTIVIVALGRRESKRS